jgi:hypothetical protein
MSERSDLFNIVALRERATRFHANWVKDRRRAMKAEAESQALRQQVSELEEIRAALKSYALEGDEKIANLQAVVEAAKDVNLAWLMDLNMVAVMRALKKALEALEEERDEAK